MGAYSVVRLRVIAAQDPAGQITITEQLRRPLTPQRLRRRTTVDAYRRIFQQFIADVQVHGQGYHADAWQALLDYFCNACKEGLRHDVQEDFIAAATALARALDEQCSSSP